jgi:uracil-DNA glycosylase
MRNVLQFSLTSFHSSLLRIPLIHIMSPTGSLNGSPAKAARLSSSSAKRPSSPASPSSSSPVKKAQKTEKAEVDSFDEDFGIDQDALLEATMIAEEEASTKLSSSSQASPPASSSSQNGKPSIPKKIEKVATVAKPSVSSPSLSKLTHGDIKMEEETMDAEWYSRLKGELQKPYFVNLKAFLKKETDAGKVIYPPAQLVHSWSRLTPLSTVKVVILGQDPYHGPNQACGHSFSVPKGVNTPGSLINMYKELATEYGPAFKKPSHG